MPITDDIESLGVIFVDPSAYSNPRLWHEKAARIRAESPILKVSVEGSHTGGTRTFGASRVTMATIESHLECFFGRGA